MVKNDDVWTIFRFAFQIFNDVIVVFSFVFILSCFQGLRRQSVVLVGDWKCANVFIYIVDVLLYGPF